MEVMVIRKNKFSLCGIFDIKSYIRRGIYMVTSGAIPHSSKLSSKSRKRFPPQILSRVDSWNSAFISFFNYLILPMLLFVLFSFCNAQDNPHKQVPFECETCHNSEQWEQVAFDHSITSFQLEGRHILTNCKDCHNLKDFALAEHHCANCHTDVHRGRLTNDCSGCHTPLGWSVIDPVKAHANTTFKLLGAHTKLDCWSCHFREVEGEFLRLSSDCIGCHRNEFNSTQNPRHSDLGFSYRCEECHTLFAWQPSDFSDHENRFPIFSGAHRGEWNKCTDCHINSASYEDFSCIENCHSRGSTDEHHDEVGGYVYAPTACYNCHSSGRGED